MKLLLITLSILLAWTGAFAEEAANERETLCRRAFPLNSPPQVGQRIILTQDLTSTRHDFGDQFSFEPAFRDREEMARISVSMERGPSVKRIPAETAFTFVGEDNSVIGHVDMLFRSESGNTTLRIRTNRIRTWGSFLNSLAQIFMADERCYEYEVLPVRYENGEDTLSPSVAL